MKSSNKLIRSNTFLPEIQTWNPKEFQFESSDNNNYINLDAEKFFGMEKVERNNKSKNLIRSEESFVDLQPWSPVEMLFDRQTIVNEINVEWTPFIEKPNPLKIADQIIEDAKIEARNILEQTQIECQKIKQESYDQGAETIHNEMSDALKAAASVINVARQWREDLLNQAEPMIMDLVKKMAQKMFGNGLVLDNEVLQSHFSEILESARSLGDLRIFMNPEDARVLGPDWREYQSSIMGSKVEIVSNDSIKRGGCYIQGEWGTADALVETQLNAILEQFSEVEKPTEGDE